MKKLREEKQKVKKENGKAASFRKLLVDKVLQTGKVDLTKKEIFDELGWNITSYHDAIVFMVAKKRFLDEFHVNMSLLSEDKLLTLFESGATDEEIMNKIKRYSLLTTPPCVPIYANQGRKRGKYPVYEWITLESDDRHMSFGIQCIRSRFENLVKETVITNKLLPSIGKDRIERLIGVPKEISNNLFKSPTSRKYLIESNDKEELEPDKLKKRYVKKDRNKN